MIDSSLISVVIPVWNQLEYTKLCLESLRGNTPPDVEIILVDNGSSDGTAEYLSSQTGLRIISNPENLGCAAAWNQGVEAAGNAEWIVILNNDVLLSKGWLEGLLSSANEWGLDIASPAFREGHDEYDFAQYAFGFTAKMSGVVRLGVAQGVCFMVKQQVFKTIGLFDENFRIGQFEDADFFRRAANAGFHLATTGRSLIHHFGSITQNSVRKKTPSNYEAENRAYYNRKWQLSWWKRCLIRHGSKLRHLAWRRKELGQYGHTLKECWKNGRLHYY